MRARSADIHVGHPLLVDFTDPLFADLIADVDGRGSTGPMTLNGDRLMLPTISRSAREDGVPDVAWTFESPGVQLFGTPSADAAHVYVLGDDGYLYAV